MEEGDISCNAKNKGFRVEENIVLNDEEEDEDEVGTSEWMTAVKTLEERWTTVQGNDLFPRPSSRVSTYKDDITETATADVDATDVRNIGEPCEYCWANLPTQESLMEHYSVTHGRHFSCARCTKAFKRLSHIETHLRCVHSLDRPFKCDICLRAFSVKSNLKRHRILHFQIGSRHFTTEGKFVNSVLTLHL